MTSALPGPDREPTVGTWHDRPTQVIAGLICGALVPCFRPPEPEMIEALRRAVRSVDAATWNQAWALWAPEHHPQAAEQAVPGDDTGEAQIAET